MYACMESVKKREKKNRFLLACFRPVAMDNGSIKPGSGDPVFKYIAGGTNKGSNNLMVPTILSPFSDEKLKVPDEDVAVGDCRRKKAKISRIIKAVFFETSLARKVRNRRARKKADDRSNSNLSTKDAKISNSSSDEKSMPQESSEIDENRTLDSNAAASSLNPSTLSKDSSRSSSMRSVNSKSSLLERKRTASFGSNSFELKQQRKNDGGNRKINYGWWLLLISLLVLIFWGRICAIFCTSTWLFFVPPRSFAQVSPGYGDGLPSAYDTVEYKKRVIMEGLLERNRSRVL